MRILRNLIVIVICLQRFLLCHCIQWSYNDPESWSNTNPLCAAQLQAPISLSNIRINNGADAFLKLQTSESEQTEIVILVQQYSLFVDLRTLQLHLVSSLTPRQEYMLRSMIVKYPCEHVLPDNAGCVVELQFMYEPVDVDVTDTSHRVVYVQQYIESSDPNVQTMPLLSTISEASRSLHTSFDSVVATVNISASEFFSDTIYVYEGSDNVPPCAPGYLYFLSAYQYSASAGVLQNLKDRSQQIVPSNARPLQAVGGRIVTRRRTYTSAPKAEFLALLNLDDSPAVVRPKFVSVPQRNPLNYQLRSAMVALACIAATIIFILLVAYLRRIDVLNLPVWLGGRKQKREYWINNVDGINVFGAIPPAPDSENSESNGTKTEDTPTATSPNDSQYSEENKDPIGTTDH